MAQALRPTDQESGLTLSRLIPNPTDVFRKVDGVVADVEDVLARVDSTLASVDGTLTSVDGTLASVDGTLTTATAVLSDVRDALAELHQELHDLRRIPAMEEELVELHHLVSAIAAAVVTPKEASPVPGKARPVTTKA